MVLTHAGLRALLPLSLLGMGLPSLAQFADTSNTANAPVPSVTYRSIFRETSLGIEQEKVDWRKANSDVGQFTRGHVDIIKQEEIESKSKPTQAAPAPHKH